MGKFLVPVIASILILSTFAFISPIDDAYAKNNKVTICHIPSGNPENAHTIAVSENAVAAHLTHGDFVGTCEDGPDCVNYPDQEACPKESILLVHAFLNWPVYGAPASGAICKVSPVGSPELIIMEFVLDENGNAEVSVPSEYTQVTINCESQIGGFYYLGVGGGTLNPEEPTSIIFILRVQNV